jgi:hypothetical protein
MNLILNDKLKKSIKKKHEKQSNSNLVNPSNT